MVLNSDHGACRTLNFLYDVGKSMIPMGAVLREKQLVYSRCGREGKLRTHSSWHVKRQQHNMTHSLLTSSGTQISFKLLPDRNILRDAACFVPPISYLWCSNSEMCGFLSWPKNTVATTSIRRSLHIPPRARGHFPLDIYDELPPNLAAPKPTTRKKNHSEDFGHPVSNEVRYTTK